MKQDCKNKGFTIVELIIVVAIMSVLIGVAAPTYLKYVERTKRTTDCSNIGAVLDACEVLAVDPDVKWLSGDANKITLVIDSNETGHETSYSPTSADVVKELEAMISADATSLKSDWGPFTIYAIRDENGHVKFDIQDDGQIGDLSKYSESLSNRLE